MLLVKKELRPDHREDIEPPARLHNKLNIVEIKPAHGTKYAIVVAYLSQQDPFPLFLHNYETALQNCCTANLTNILE